MKEPKQSSRIVRKTIEEMEDGTLAIRLHDDNSLVLIRFVLLLGRRVPEVALLDDADDANSAQIVTGRCRII